MSRLQTAGELRRRCSALSRPRSPSLYSSQLVRNT